MAPVQDSTHKSSRTQRRRISTGVVGLDEVLQGGLISQKSYLVRGGPGGGKTTLGMHFLAEGLAQGETTLLITLGEPAEQIVENSPSLGEKAANLHYLDLSPDAEFFTDMESYAIFAPAEVEREPITQKIIDKVRELKPQRIFIDSINQFRYLAANEFQFRKQVLSCLRFLSGENATVLLSSEYSPESPDSDLQFMCDGVISLQLTEDYRSVRIRKFRGSSFRNGCHSMRLTDTGMKVFPKLIPNSYRREFTTETIPSNIPGLDDLLHGGIERGTVTILSGPSGGGKTTTGVQFLTAAAGRGDRSILYTFEEEVINLVNRAAAISIPAKDQVAKGTLSIAKIEPMQYAPDEFAAIVRKEVENHDTQIIMLDSVSGYSLTMEGDDVVTHLHALCKYLTNMGVTVLLINETESLAGGDLKGTEDGFTYLADNLILMRYMERHEDGQVELRKNISVVKKRLSDFEKTLREFKITPGGIKVSRPLEGLDGILSAEAITLDKDEEGS